MGAVGKLFSIPKSLVFGLFQVSVGSEFSPTCGANVSLSACISILRCYPLKSFFLFRP